MVTRSVLHVGPGGPGVPPHTHDGSEIEGVADLIHLRVDQLLAGTITGKEVILAGGAAGVIHSDNFASGVDGWAIFGDGSAEFNDVVVRGTIVAGTGSEVDWSYIRNVSIENADIVSLSFDKITAGSNDASLVIGAAGSISSANYAAGSDGFQILGTGDAEFNNVTVRGVIIAGPGSEVDWDYVQNISVSNAHIASVSFDKLTAATNTASLVIGSGGSIASANYSAGSAGFRILGTGDAEFNSVTIRGVVSAQAGSDIDWDYLTNVAVTDGDIVNVGASKLIAGTIAAQEIILSNSTSSILRSSNYSAGSSGWRIRGNGDAEFNNVTVRGTIFASAGELGTLTATGTIAATGSGRVRSSTGTSYIELGNPNGSDSAGRMAIRYIWSGSEKAHIYLEDLGVNLSFLIYADAPIAINPDGNHLYLRGASQVVVPNGGSAAPGLTFGNAQDAGLYYSDVATQLHVVVGGDRRATWGASGYLNFAVRDNTSGSAANVVINSTSGQMMRSTSARKYKSRITYNVDYLADIELRPTKFYRKDDHSWFFGFIADDLADQHPLLATYDDTGEVENYDQRAVLAVLAAKVNRLEAEIARLKEAA